MLFTLPATPGTSRNRMIDYNLHRNITLQGRQKHSDSQYSFAFRIRIGTIIFKASKITALVLL